MINVLIKIIAFAGALTAVVLYFLNSHSRVDLQRELSESRSAALSVENERDRALADITALDHKLADLNSGLDSEKAKTASFQRQNLQARREIFKLGEELKSADEDRHNWEDEAQSLRRQLLSAEAGIQKEFQDASAEYDARILGLRENITVLQDELSNYRSIAPGVPGSGKTIEGTILDIGPQNSIVALDIGVDHGVLQGMQLTLRQSDGSQAQVILSIVRPGFSLGYILADFGKLNKLIKGRKVTIILP